MIDDDISDARRPRAVLPWVLAAGLLMFAIGMIASPWFEANIRSQLPGALHKPDVGAVAARLDRQASALAELETRVVMLESRPVAELQNGRETPLALNDPAAAGAGFAGLAAGDSARLLARVDVLDRGQGLVNTRLDNLSAEIARLSARVETSSSSATESIAAAAASAAKARGVLLVATARRAAEQGQSLAVLEPALRRQFARDNADAVETLLTASQSAPTLAAVKTRFDALRPSLAVSVRPAGDSWWTRFKADLADIVSVQRAGSSAAGDANAARLAEMAARIDRGDVAGALLMLRRLPAAAQRTAIAWRRDAEAYAATYGALAQLEAAVLLEDADLPLSAAGTPRDPDLGETTL